MIPLQPAASQVPSSIPSTMSGTPPGQAGQQLQIHDIHLPEQVSNLPTAIGWWLLIAIIIITAIWLIKKLKHNKKLNQSKHHALSVLNTQTSLNNGDLISLLKWGAMQYFNRQHVATLYGDSFQQFLMDKLPEKHQKEFIKLSNQAFLTQYKINTEQGKAIDNNADCKSAVKLWLTHALPPKESNTPFRKSINGGSAHD